MKGIAGERPAARVVAAAAAAALGLGAPAPAALAGHSTGHAPSGGLVTGAVDARSSLEQFVEGLDPLMVATAAPVLAHLIESSRDQAIAQGVRPIPASIRAALAGYVPRATLDRVRWCVQCGGLLSLQRSAFLFQYAPAITLDDVVVFEKREDALGDPSLWAHELKHVMQYREWGVDGFAKRYLEDYEAVESEAAEYRWQWMKRTHYLERRHAAGAGAAARGGRARHGSTHGSAEGGSAHGSTQGGSAEGGPANGSTEDGSADGGSAHGSTEGGAARVGRGRAEAGNRLK